LFTEAKVEDSVFKDMAATRKFWKPHPDEYAADASSSTAAKKEEKDNLENSVENERATKSVPITTTIVSTPTEIKTNTGTPPIRPDIAKINEQFKKRKQVFQKELQVESDSIRLSFYDNAEIDGDSISVFLNGDLVIAHQELTERAFNLYIKLDSTKEVNEVSMFAENLGKYPPNTALMVVSDGENRYETFLSSDFKGNAVIKFKRKKSVDKL
jgi:hypothetical protein